MARRRKGNVVNGILLLNKAYEISSNKALQQAKHLYKAQKAGHTGSLDPLATGMLPICFGEATKVCAHLLDANKAYRAEVTLGITTSTEDGEGDVVARKDVPKLSLPALEKILDQFRGEIEQVPPMHSALWHEGKRLYEIAREGKVVDIKPRQVTIKSLDLIKIEGDKLILGIVCTKGTYIRSLSRDIGVAIGCGAYMSALHRTYVEPFDQHAMIDYAELEAKEDPLSQLIPVDQALLHYKAMPINDEQAADVFLGRKIHLNDAQMADFAADFVAGETLRLYRNIEESQQLLGLVHYEGEAIIAPKRLMHL